MKLLIIGSAGHGKDTAAMLLQELYGYTFKSSSIAAAEIFLFDAMKAKYGYKTIQECFEDRVHRRDEWYKHIREYNRVDPTRLAREILKRADIYVGMRDNTELDHCLKAGMFDLVIGIYDPRKSQEPSSSFNIDFWTKVDVVVPNSGTIEDLKYRLGKLGLPDQRIPDDWDSIAEEIIKAA